MTEQDMAEIYGLAKQVYLKKLRQIDARQQIQSKISVPLMIILLLIFVLLYVICLMELGIHVE